MKTIDLSESVPDRWRGRDKTAPSVSLQSALNYTSVVDWKSLSNCGWSETNSQTCTEPAGVGFGTALTNLSKQARNLSATRWLI